MSRSELGANQIGLLAVEVARLAVPGAGIA